MEQPVAIVDKDMWGIIFFELDRVDGQPDNCGNPPPPDWPDNTPTDIDINIDVTTPTPVPPDDPTGPTFPPITIPIVIPPIINGEVNFNVDDINFVFQIDGVEINFGGGGDDIVNTVNNINNTVNDIDNKVTIVFPGNPDDVDEEPGPTGDEIEEEVGEEFVWLYIDVTTNPIAEKTILQPNPLNNTFFAGYVSFLVDGQYTPEQPIRKKFNAYPVIPGTTGFRAWAVNGASLSSRIITRKVEPPE